MNINHDSPSPLHTKSNWRRNRCKRTPLGVEPLEDRRVLAVTIAVDDVSVVEEDDSLAQLDYFVTSESGTVSKPRDSVFGPDVNGDGFPEFYLVSADTDEILRYDGRSGHFLDTFVESGSGGLSSPTALAFGPDGSLFVIQTSDRAVVLKYDGTTGEFDREFVTSGSGGLSFAMGLAIHPNGDLLVANGDGHNVLRYDAVSGAFVGEFVTAGSGGLDLTRRINYGSDGNGDGQPDLYVISRGTDEVLRYDGLSGQFIDVFATHEPSWQPKSIVHGSDGNAYLTLQYESPCCNTRIQRHDAETGVLLDIFDNGEDGWSVSVGPDNNIYLSGNSAGNFVKRIGFASQAAFRVTLSEPSAADLTVDFATSDGSATAGADYTAVSGTLRFAPGETSKTIIVPTLDDTEFEPAETFFVNLTNPIGVAAIADAQGQGTIEASTASEPNWFEQHEVTDPLSLDANDHLSGVAIEGDTLVLGNRRDDTAGTDAGAVLIYTRNDKGTPGNPADDRWILQQTLIPDDLQTGDHFGIRVAIDGDRLVVGADHPTDLTTPGDGLGVAYVYQRVNEVWQFEHKLLPVDIGGTNDRFGFRVAIEGDVIAVSAAQQDTNAGPDAGAVHVYHFDPNTSQWSTGFKVTASDAAANDWFGQGVYLEDGELFVGAITSVQTTRGAGTVYVFGETTPGVWEQTARFQASDAHPGDNFGGRVAAEDGILAVGATGEGAYVFTKDASGQWNEDAKLQPSQLGTNVGRGLGIASGTIAVAAPKNDGNVANSGAVFLFEKIDGTWTEVDKLFESQRSPDDEGTFAEVAISTDHVAVITNVNNNTFREAFVFAQDDSRTRETKLSSDTPKNLRDARGNSSGKTTSSIEFAEPLEVIDVNVRLDINHNSVDHLDVFLISPDGSKVELFSDIGGTGNNFSATIIDDDAARDIASPSAPFTGNFRPVGNLNLFRGISATGTWTLEINDDQRGTSGTLEFWSLSIVGRIPGSSTPPPGGGNDTDIYVESLVFDSRVKGKNGSIHDERLIGTVRRDSDADGIVEGSDEPVAGAVATIQLTGPVNQTLVTVTDANGQLTTDWVKDVPDGDYTATLTSLVLSPLQWNPDLGVTSANHFLPHASSSFNATAPHVLIALDGSGDVYSQDFDQALGTDPSIDAALPEGWVAYVDGLQTRRTSVDFPPSALDHVSNAGLDSAVDRALVLGRNAGNSLELEAEVVEQSVSALRLAFDIETWGALPPITGLGEASFNVTLEAETSSGFTNLANLGTFSTGKNLTSEKQGTGTFAPAYAVPDSNSSFVIRTADFNGDGHLDFANVLTNSGLTDDGGMVNVQMGNGDGTFAAPTSYPAGHFPTDMTATDVDGDGDIDLAITNFDFFEALTGNFPPEDGVHILLNRGDGSFQQGEIVSAGLGPNSISSADFNQDGNMDLVTANSFDGDLSLLLSNGDGTFRERVLETDGLTPWSVVAVDFDKNGNVDLVSTDVDALTVSLFWNAGGADFDQPIAVPVEDAPVHGTATDLNGDGREDLIYTSFSSDEILVLLQQSNGRFGDPIRYAAGPGAWYFELADVNQDSRSDVVVATSQGVSVLAGQADGTFAPAVIHDIRANAGSLAAADIDGDSDLDVAVAGSSDVQILLNDPIVLDGNQSGHRASFDTGVVNVSIPHKARFLVRFEVPDGSQSDRFVFGLDNVRLTALAAGDSNGDLQFDQLDIVQVLQADRYLRGTDATFEQGDWNGDGRFNQLDIVAALQTGNYLRGEYAFHAHAYSKPGDFSKSIGTNPTESREQLVEKLGG